jgi:cell volume regulation protein A
VTLEITSLRDVDGDIVEYTAGPESRAAGKRVRDLALPDGVVIALIARGQEFIPPRGSTGIQAGDSVFVVLRSGVRPLVDRIFGRDRKPVEEMPATLEFPLRGTTTVGELEEFYGIRLDASGECTLEALLREHLSAERIAPGHRVDFGEIALSVRVLGDGGEIEQVGLTILAAAGDTARDGAEQTAGSEGAVPGPASGGEAP